MTKVTATGIESALVTDWSGWDGDHEWMCFYDTSLRPEIKAELIKQHGMPEGTVDVDIDLTELIATINVYSSEEDHGLVFSHKVRLIVTANFTI